MEAGQGVGWWPVWRQGREMEAGDVWRLDCKEVGPCDGGRQCIGDWLVWRLDCREAGQCDGGRTVR